MLTSLGTQPKAVTFTNEVISDALGAGCLPAPHPNRKRYFGIQSVNTHQKKQIFQVAEVFF